MGTVTLLVTKFGNDAGLVFFWPSCTNWRFRPCWNPHISAIFQHTADLLCNSHEGSILRRKHGYNSAFTVAWPEWKAPNTYPNWLSVSVVAKFDPNDLEWLAAYPHFCSIISESAICTNKNYNRHGALGLTYDDTTSQFWRKSLFAKIRPDIFQTDKGTAVIFKTHLFLTSGRRSVRFLTIFQIWPWPWPLTSDDLWHHDLHHSSR